MKKLFFGLFAICIIHAVVAQDAAGKLDTLLNAYAKTFQFNASVLVAKNGTILLNKGYGYRNAGDKVLNSEQTIFQLGSITKQFTSAVILKLQEEKKLDVTERSVNIFRTSPKETASP